MSGGIGGLGGAGPEPLLAPQGPEAPQPASEAQLRSTLVRDDPVLAAVLRGERELALGERGDHVRALQDALAVLGHRPAGGADGAFGRGTEAALAAFQRANGLAASGRLDRETLLAIDRKLTGSDAASAGRSAALPAPVPLTGAPASYLADRVEREAYEFIERKLWTGSSWARGIDLAVTDQDTLAVLDRLETLSPRQYNHVLHALAATKTAEALAPTLLDKLIVRGTSQFGHAALSDRFCEQLKRKLENEPENRILRHISPQSVDRLKNWADFQRLIDLFA